ncbi:MAG TPA: hypothetical protein PKH80_04875 [Methanofastidiosum sp.]|nr:hypothetical protein [Methanofastidiosum sp.]HNU62051.1 hypothetical protein [Methanofastidiosum sp.]
MEENPKCPKCGGENTIPICYGMPGWDMVESYHKGEIELGGCCIDEDSPSWYCKDCKNRWGRLSFKRN